MSDDVWDLVLTNVLFDNFTELETGLLRVNFMGKESTFDVHEDSEMLISSLDGDNVHLTEWEFRISSDLSINLDQTFLVLNNLSGFTSVESVLLSLLEETGKWHALSNLVWTWRWSNSINSLKFSEIPLLWSGNSLHRFSLTLIALNFIEKTC